MGPGWEITTLVLLAALLHAIWNALVKSSGDRMLTLATVVFTGSLLCFPLIFLVPIPLMQSWPYIIGSVFVHSLYYLFLLLAYKYGDLSHAYPIARGVGPLLVAGVAVVCGLETLTFVETIGVLCVSAGIVGLAFSSGDLRKGAGRSILFAIVTGIMIGAYTLIDGLGVRSSPGNEIGYIAWLHLLESWPIVIGAVLIHRKRIATFARMHGSKSILGGVMATIAYGMVVWAMSLSPMAHVAALREVSVILAAIIGTRFLGESFGPRRVAAAAIVALGIVLMNL